MFQESLFNVCFGKLIKERFDELGLKKSGEWTVQKILNNEKKNTDMKIDYPKLGLDCRNMQWLLQPTEAANSDEDFLWPLFSVYVTATLT